MRGPENGRLITDVMFSGETILSAHSWHVVSPCRVALLLLGANTLVETTKSGPCRSLACSAFVPLWVCKARVQQACVPQRGVQQRLRTLMYSSIIDSRKLDL
jgi:hypothetical protein